jgi:hypothetical protein
MWRFWDKIVAIVAVRLSQAVFSLVWQYKLVSASD